MSAETTALLRQLPSVNELLLQANSLIALEGHDRTVRALRIVLDDARTHIKTGGTLPTLLDLIAQAEAHLQLPISNLQSPISNLLPLSSTPQVSFCTLTWVAPHSATPRSKPCWPLPATTARWNLI